MCRKEQVLHNVARWFTRRYRNMLKSPVLYVVVGGAIGTYMRYTVSKWINSQPWGQAFPYGTLVVNVSGSFLLAVAAVLFLETLPPRYQHWYLLVGTGFCGGYTTFSTFEWETFKLMRDGGWWYAAANVVASLLAAMAGVLLGVALMGLLLPRKMD